MPDVSVIVPVYRAEKYIERCCRSLFEQTLDNIEYIFVDDCTPDRSMEIIQKILDDFPQRKTDVKILHNPTNLGVSETRKKGVKASTGNYVIHCDPDDWADVTAYEKLYDYAKKNDFDIVSCMFYKVDQAGNKRLILEEKQNDVLKQLLIGQRQGSLWNRLVRGNIARSNAILFPEKNMGEDLALVLQYYYYSSRCGEICEPLYYYNNNLESITSFGNPDKLLRQAYEMASILETIIQFLYQKGLIRNYSREIVARKFFNKRWILPAIRSAKDCSYWVKLHPDINYSLFFNPYISSQDKVTSLLVELYAYPLLRKILRNR